MKPNSSRVHSLSFKLATAGLALVLSGCVVAPPYHRGYYPGPRVHVWVPFPIWFVPVSGYPHAEGAYDRDRMECYRRAVRETGIDPGGMTTMQEQRAEPPRGAEVAAGAAVGAVAGGVLSSPRNAGAGIVIGALVGAAVGAAAQDARERATPPPPPRREPGASEPATRAEQEDFRRSMSACMEQRGYRPR